MTSVFTNASDIIARQTNSSLSQTIWFSKRDQNAAGLIVITPVSGYYSDLWLNNSTLGSSASIPGTAAACDTLTTGSLYFNKPTGKLWLMGGNVVVASTAGTTTGAVIIYDRLTHMGGLSGIVTTPQLVSCSSTRYTGSNAPGTKIYLYVQTGIGATQVNINATYINQSGITSITPSASIGGTNLNEAGRVIPLPLAPGDNGVTAVNSIILSATTAATGSFGIFIGRPLLTIPTHTYGIAVSRDTAYDVIPIPQVESTACLAILWYANSSITPVIHGSLHLIEK
jgi:hypothetical protein